MFFLSDSWARFKARKGIPDIGVQEVKNSIQPPRTFLLPLQPIRVHIRPRVVADVGVGVAEVEWVAEGAEGGFL
jgi:hypothetical protein